MKNIAILVIDMQEGLCVGESKPYDCEGTIMRINQVTEKARAANVPVIFIQHESSSDYLAYASDNWQLADSLIVQDSDLRVRKTTPDSFLCTDLEVLLKARGTEKLVICGMHTEFCVDTTTRRALALGYSVVLVADGHTSAGNEAISAPQVIAHHNATLSNISSFGPRVEAVLVQNLVF